MISVAEIFGNGMIFQRNKKIKIWGKTSDQKEVTVKFKEKEYVAHRNGQEWKVEIDECEAGGPYEMEIQCGDENIKFQDILIGEVWLAGGQSNMELELKDSDNGIEEANNADYEEIRFYNVPKVAFIEEGEEPKGNWEKAKGEITGTMSAVGYYFAKELYEKLGVPIGIIDCYWGGSSALTWIGEEISEEDEQVYASCQEFMKVINSKTDEQFDKEMKEYNDEWTAWDARVQKLRKENPDIQWEKINEKAGLCPWPQPMGRKSPYRPFGLHETMIMKVAPYTITGFIYYQGEEDWSRSAFYHKMNTMVIRQWRQDFEDESLAFYITQLPMYMAKGDVDDKNWCVLRDEQMKTEKENDNVGLAVLIDCGEFDNIHPTDKKTPGYRLACQALGKTYGVIEKFDNMYIDKFKTLRNRIRINFKNTYGKINIKGDQILGFEVSETGRAYYKADAILDGDSIILQCDKIDYIRCVRYAWTNYGTVNVYNKEWLPLAPFNE